MTILSPEHPELGTRGRFLGNAPDVVLMVSMITLMAFGTLMVFSASRDSLAIAGLDETSLMDRQAMFAAIGLVMFIVLSIVDYRLYQHFWIFVFGATLAILVVVLFMPEQRDVTRAIPLPGGLQILPAEFAKVAMILVVATLLSLAEGDDLPWARIGQILLVLAVPMGLVFLQPDLGTSLVFAFVALVMLFAGGANLRQLGVLVGGSLAAVWAILRFGLLATYQEERITSLFNWSDTQGSAYNQIQSMTTIGSGQIFGKGLFNGALTSRAFVPEQETDFIFTAVGEQFGFVGAVVLLALYTIIILRLIRIAVAATDRFGTLVCLGIASLFVFHVFVNVGMTVRIMPVTGLPLPFMSAGGSSLIAMAMALGVANSIWLRRARIPGARIQE